ncbi:HupE/UreJ family protein [Novipirellula rosea]|uniref:HupE/UreJ family protein n=1 Tax=Novipirellula rosea TaxID=1031540 RepID=A0ABP8N241_9BACT
MNRWMTLAAAVFVISFPSIALAHPGHGPADHGISEHTMGGFTHGLTHPLTGVDHLLTLIAVALIAVRIGGRAMWAVPAAFLAMGAIGASAASLGWNVPMAEAMIIGSVLVGGLTLASRRTAPTFLLSVICGFGLFHGYAHVIEMAGTDTVASYSIGLMATSLGMIVIAMVAARSAQRLGSTETFTKACRIVGGSLTVAAIAMMLVHVG